MKYVACQTTYKSANATIPGLPLMRLNNPVCFGWSSLNVWKNPVNMIAKNPARHE